MKVQGAVVAVVIGMMSAVLAGCGGEASPDTSAPVTAAAQRTAEPKPTPTPTPSPAPVDDPRIFDIGEPVPIADYTYTLTSFEVVHEIATVDGAPITAAAGEELVLFHGHFVNGSNSPVDLSCSLPDGFYSQVFDTEKREMAAVYDTYRIPGNPECNYQLLPGQESDWSFAFRGTDGATPLGLQITDSRSFDDFVVIDLVGQGLTITG